MSLNKKTVDKVRKPINHKAMDGLVRPLVEKIPYYLDSIIKSGVATLPPEIGLSYNGWRMLSPYESYNEQFKGSGKTTLDTSKSTLYKVVFSFNFRGEDINRVLYLPYTERGAIISLSDAVYSIVPVLTDYVISPTTKEVFLRLLKDKLIFKRIEKNVIKDGLKTPVSIITAHAYKIVEGTNQKVPMALYLFVKHGFYGAFEKYLGFKPKIIKGIVPEDMKKDYTVYETVGKKPRILNDDNYTPHDIKILVPKDKVSPVVDTIVGSLITTFDLLNQFSNFLPDILSGRSKMPEKEFWMMLLGKTIFRNNYRQEKILSSMEEYLSLIDSYIDPIIESKLRENGVYVDDFYDLIFYIIKNYDKLILNYEKRSTQIDNKYIDVLYYLMFETISSINKSLYGIIKEYNKKGERITTRDVENVFNKQFTPKKFFSSIKGGSTNIALMPVDYSGDNYAFKITSILEDQNRGRGVERDKNASFPAFSRNLHAEDLYIGNILYLTKKSPSPRFRINPFVKVDIESGKILLDDEMKERLTLLETMLEGKFQDDNILEKEVLDTDLDI